MSQGVWRRHLHEHPHTKADTAGYFRPYFLVAKNIKFTHHAPRKLNNLLAALNQLFPIYPEMKDIHNDFTPICSGFKFAIADHNTTGYNASSTTNLLNAKIISTVQYALFL